MIKLCILGLLPNGEVDENRRYWIAGNPVKEQALHTGFADENRAISRTRQEESGTNFPFKKPVDTANESFNEPFKTTLTFEGADAAEQAWLWCNSFSRLDPALWPHPIQGDFIFRFERSDGTFVDERLFDGLITKPTINRVGGTVELSYTLTGGRIEPLSTGRVVYPVATALLDYTIGMKLYGTVSGGAFTDGTYSGGGGIPPTLDPGLGAIWTIQGIDNITSETLNKEFQLVSPGGSASGGRIAITYPLAENMDEVAAAYASETLMQAVYVPAIGGDRAHVRLQWMPAVSILAEARISIYASSGGSGGEFGSYDTTAETVPSGEVFPMDDNGDIPTADEPV